MTFAGQVVVATSIKKDNELSIVIYNSLTCKDENYTRDQMKGFVWYVSLCISFTSNYNMPN